MYKKSEEGKEKEGRVTLRRPSDPSDEFHANRSKPESYGCPKLHAKGAKGMHSECAKFTPTRSLYAARIAPCAFNVNYFVRRAREIN